MFVRLHEGRIGGFEHAFSRMLEICIKRPIEHSSIKFVFPNIFVSNIACSTGLSLWDHIISSRWCRFRDDIIGKYHRIQDDIIGGMTS